MFPSYISKNIDELLQNAPKEILELLQNGEVDKTATILGKVYKIPISSYVPLSNIISSILLGALKPEDVLHALGDILKMSPEDAYKLAQDLDKSILEKARIQILGKSDQNVVTLSFDDARTPDELRKEILDTTKRESGIIKNQSSPSTVPAKKPIVLTPGSRSQLLEQLQVLGDIPNDEEIETRLSHIQEQISSLDAGNSRNLDTNVPLQEFMFGEKGDTVAPVEARSASYSKAPTKYNVDPYREVTEA